MRAGTGRKVLKTVAAVLAGLSRNRHFVIGMVVLLVVAATVTLLGWVVKYPVPWPEDVEVDEEFRMLSLADRFGPYAKVADIGEVILKRSTKRALGLGTSYDRARYPKRRSNWYVIRLYEDTRIADRDDPYKFWHLEVYYYTGLRDKVPHVPLRCLEAAGAKVLSQEKVIFRAPAAPEPWDEEIAFQRTHWERINRIKQRQQGAEYYVFSLNGGQERRWEKERFKMGLPLPRYNYFAKIQFSPAGRTSMTSVSEADKAAAEFVKYSLPSIVATLPSAEDISKLGKADKLEMANN